MADLGNLKAGDPYPGKPGHIIGADGSPIEIRDSNRVKDPYAPGGANRPISESEAMERYGTTQGVNVSGVPTRPYVEGHDSRQIPTTPEDLAFTVRTRGEDAAVRRYVAENPERAALARQINERQRLEEVEVTNPRLLGIESGGTYETTTRSGQRIRLLAGPGGEFTVQGESSPEAVERLRELGFSVREPEARQPSGGYVPTRYRGIEPFVTEGVRLYPGDRGAALQVDAARSIGTQPVASFRQGGFLAFTESSLSRQRAEYEAYVAAVQRARGGPRQIMGVTVVPTGSYAGPEFFGIPMPFGERQSNPYSARAAENQERAARALAAGYAPAVLAAREGRIGKGEAQKFALQSGVAQAGAAAGVQFAGGFVETGVAMGLDLTAPIGRAQERVFGNLQSGALPEARDVYVAFVPGGFTLEKPSETLFTAGTVALAAATGPVGRAVASRVPALGTPAATTVFRAAVPVGFGAASAALEPREEMRAFAFGRGFGQITAPYATARAVSQVAAGSVRTTEPRVVSIARVTERTPDATRGIFVSRADAKAYGLLGSRDVTSASAGEFALRPSKLAPTQRATFTIDGGIQTTGVRGTGRLRGSGTLAYAPTPAAQAAIRFPTTEPLVSLQISEGFNPMTGRFEFVRRVSTARPSVDITAGVREQYAGTSRSTVTFPRQPRLSGYSSTRSQIVPAGEFPAQGATDPFYRTVLQDGTIYRTRGTGAYQTSSAAGTQTGGFSQTAFVIDAPLPSRVRATGAAPFAPTRSFGARLARGPVTTQTQVPRSTPQTARQISSALTEVVGGRVSSEATKAANVQAQVLRTQALSAGARLDAPLRGAPTPLAATQTRTRGSTRERFDQTFEPFTLSGTQALQIERTSTLRATTQQSALQTQLQQSTVQRAFQLQAPITGRLQPQAQLQSLTPITARFQPQAQLQPPQAPRPLRPFPVGPLPPDPIPPFPPFRGGFPNLLITTEDVGGGRRGRARYQYTPSLAAIVGNIRARRAPRQLTGIEIRPLIETTPRRRARRTR